MNPFNFEVPNSKAVTTVLIIPACVLAIKNTGYESTVHQYCIIPC